ncbi:PREDICTED: pentatricopeptide repeat-containing protein ELI1, chloroplastic-like [Nicotiana attenuata]|uniref:Pentatricopeptide repeat-containing protein eli1, chloroplastic n=1 Tax=Nicotiana attenuata TaxID=49451 RepID=A0A314L8Z3_NICAT|nr:PREDICTED: pentatricopeptide repeat-containing protein ELI1, chloroplastic-like [Nicotiana attenuata]XP_019262030.1 PREDICTED: pentatricopeptide repeat-containing protein ELI1, chloroplastic-like [Nicotiana attenuata]OIT38086.1 pentatricopeptide repeat-containing protein eli1, chloroplastic [Nicotiana attenuata]
MSGTSLFSNPPLYTTSTTSKYIHRPSPHKLKLLIDKSKSIRQLLQIHAFLIRYGLESDSVLNFKLQKSYSSLGHLKHSVSVFKLTQSPTVFSYSAIIHSHVINDLCEQAFVFYIQMLTQNIEPNAFTFSSILKASPHESGKALHCQALKLGCDSDIYVRTALVDVYARGSDIVSARKLFDTMTERSLVTLTTMITGYAKNGHVQEARVLFDGMEEKDVVCWNAMIDGYSQHGRPNEALVLFKQMLLSKVKPNEVTVVAALSACAQMGVLESGRWIHAYVKSNRIQLNKHVGTALIDMYSKSGSLEDARMVFDQMKDKDVITWNSMIVGYAMHGFSLEALQLFNEMCELGLQPTDITFIGILSACANAGLVAEGWDYFHLMDKYRIEPKIEHYGCMVNLLGRAGQLEEAYEFVNSMKIDSDPILWGTLLTACRIHGNIRLAEKIMEFLVQQDLATSGTYVLLSNIYASAGDWDGVAKVRALMKSSGVDKEPGCSSIEVNNKVHEFLAGDMKHHKSKEIYRMLEEMNKWLEAHGYMPQTDVVLHNLGEVEKQKSLAVHSERLAIAYGLISTQPGTTIKIVKNLRVCPDCHSVTKLISKITGRKIIVRDRNRFHHFVEGSCSCGDFW